ncbi:MAG: tetratricopeptide repeat protein [Bacteroidales bacterium]|nr:tetratricopeptide repeat protein [Bacteroidales bacterium]
MRLTLLVLFISLVSLTNGQDLNAAGAKFNEGLELDKAKNYAGAIKAWQESVKICEGLGAEADELKSSVEKKIAYTYFKQGITLYKKKNFDAAISALVNAEKLSGAVGDDKTQKQAATYIPKIYATKGLTLMQNKNYDNALEVFDKALGYNPKCVDAFYGKGMTYKEMDQIENATAAFDNVIKYGAGVSAAEKKIESAKEAAQIMLEAKAASELQIEHSAEAAALLTQVLKYSQTSPNTFYLLALANNKLKKWDAAIEAGQKALTLEGTDASAVNFELGKAFEGKNDKTNACAAYKKVTTGPNVEAAKFQVVEVLKCN